MEGGEGQKALQSEHTHAKLGKRLFIDASREHPASVTKQGVFIALACKEQGLNPLDVRQDLFRSQTELADSIHTAQTFHEGINRKREAEGKEPLEIPTEDQAKDVIHRDFLAAVTYYDLPPEALHEILNFHIEPSGDIEKDESAKQAFAKSVFDRYFPTQT